MMLDYQIAALNAVREYAKLKAPEHHACVELICQQFNVDVQSLIDKVLSNSITINFHPDRLSNNGKTIMENLIEQGQYYSQFRTDTTNGGTGIHVGGNRFVWEQNMFSDTYPHDSSERPKYGALNIFRYIDGASARFGSCFFTLAPHVRDRCTFAYGDSSTDPTTLCTSDTFIGILASLFEDVQQNDRFLNHVIAHEQEALAIMLNPSSTIKNIGRNLDYCIETHIHGDVSLAKDVDSFYIDESFRQTLFAEQAKELCRKYDIKLNWIPCRELAVDAICEFFRGPKILLLAQRIDSIFGGNQGVINAALIGEASRNSLLHSEKWYDLGSDADLFQYFKQLWHTVVFFG